MAVLKPSTSKLDSFSVSYLARFFSFSKCSFISFRTLQCFITCNTVLFLQEEDNRTVSICESVASTVTAPSDGEQLLSDNEDNHDTDDSGTASAPSPRPLNLDDRGNIYLKNRFYHTLQLIA